MLIKLVIVFEIAFIPTVFDLVERWLRNVNMATLYQLRHLSIKKRQQKRSNVTSVDIRVGHDNDSVVSQFVERIILGTDSGSQCRN